METVVAFGKTGLKLELLEGPRYEIIHAQSAPALADATSAIEAGLDAPIGSPSLLQLAQGKKSAAISICDITRPAPNRITLPPLLARLHRAGLKHQDITLCIATGLHRIATQAELDHILGPDIARSYPILNHDAKDAAQHRVLGETKRGTPVAIASAFLDAGLHITLGFIEQHLMLGFSGGRKMVAPGLAAQETIKTIHSPRFMREALATEGSIEHNPLHAELLEIAGMARHDFMLDVTLTQDRRISGVFAGEPVSAHAAGVQFMRRSSIEYLDGFVDAAITSAAGFPLDLTLYQTVKGITAVQHIVKPGGPILAIGECAEGIGSPEFARKVSSYRDASSFLAEIGDSPVVADQWQLEKLALVAEKNPVLLYVPGADSRQLGGLRRQTFAQVDEAIAALLRGLPKNARIAVIPDGPYACVRVGRQTAA